MFSFLDFDKPSRGKVKLQGDDRLSKSEVPPDLQFRTELNHLVHWPRSQE